MKEVSRRGVPWTYGSCISWIGFLQRAEVSIVNESEG